MFWLCIEQLVSIEKSSEEEVQRLVSYKWRGLQRLRENLGDANIDYCQHGGYEIFMDADTEKAEYCFDQMDRLNNLFKEVIGHSDIYSVANDKITAFGFKGVSRMIYNPYEGQLHTGKMKAFQIPLDKDKGELKTADWASLTRNFARPRPRSMRARRRFPPSPISTSSSCRRI